MNRPKQTNRPNKGIKPMLTLVRIPLSLAQLKLVETMHKQKIDIILQSEKIVKSSIPCLKQVETKHFLAEIVIVNTVDNSITLKLF